MALEIRWDPNIGDAITFNADDLIYPINGNISVELPFSDPEVRRMQLGGEWASFGYAGAPKLTLEGSILGTTTALFVQHRRAFLEALTPPDGELESRRHGILYYEDTDEPEFFEAYCRIISRQADLDTDHAPSACGFFVTWKAFSPYWTGRSTGTQYAIG